MTYYSSPCENLVREFANALVMLNSLQEKVPEEIEDAVGRLRDRFEFLPGEMNKVLMSVDLEEKPFVREASEDAVAIIDKLRREMDQRGTTKVLEYTTEDPKQELQVIINKLRTSIVQEASDSLSDCYCSSVCPRR